MSPLVSDAAPLASPLEKSSPETSGNQRLSPAARAATTDVYAIHGAEPEVLAYAMAKYSRSSLTLRESLAEISTQRAEQFLNTFYFQYGHRSIADLAHVPMAVERLSLLAAITLVDETRWDGQERSTRYQDFRRSGWYAPALGAEVRQEFNGGVERLFTAYERLSEGMTQALKRTVPRPEAMKPESYERTLAGEGVRRGTLLAAAGYEYVIRANCECAHPGDADFAAAFEPVRGSSIAWREASRGGQGSCVEPVAGAAGGDGGRGRD